jgi:hypothetical protein
VHRNYYYPTSTSPQIHIPTLTSLRDGSRSLQYTCDLCHVNSYPVQDQSHSYGATTQELYNPHDDSRSHSTLLATDCPRDYPAHAYTIHTAHTIKQPNSTPNTKPTNQQMCHHTRKQCPTCSQLFYLTHPCKMTQYQSTSCANSVVTQNITPLFCDGCKAKRTGREETIYTEGEGTIDWGWEVEEVDPRTLAGGWR